MIVTRHRHHRPDKATKKARVGAVVVTVTVHHQRLATGLDKPPVTIRIVAVMTGVRALLVVVTAQPVAVAVDVARRRRLKRVTGPHR